MEHLDVIVVGRPRPQGSKRHVGNGRIIEQNGKQRGAWRKLVEQTFRAALKGAEPIDEPVTIEAVFFFARPKNHYGTGKNADKLKPGNDPAPMTRNYGDIDKLQRSLFDGMDNAGVFVDDARICSVFTGKEWCQPGTQERVEVTVTWGFNRA